MQIDTFIVNSFTDQAFAGNPAGICLLKEALNEDTMQAIAAQLNMSETAFLQEATTDSYSIRYFTPTVEIDFCGHATLAAAKVILDKIDLASVKVITSKGLEIIANNSGAMIKMVFPLYNTIEYLINEVLLDAFGVKDFMSYRFCEELDMLLIEVVNKNELLAIEPDYRKAVASTSEIKEVVVTTKSEDGDYDFYSRCFCPWIGIDEDPVTGAAHSVLAKYWSDRLGKKELSAFQLSDRGGFLDLKIISEHKLEVYSQAQIVFEGKMNI